MMTHVCACMRARIVVYSKCVQYNDDACMRMHAYNCVLQYNVDVRMHMLVMYAILLCQFEKKKQKIMHVRVSFRGAKGGYFPPPLPFFMKKLLPLEWP